MSNISANMVKTLREATGLGMMECKKALVECEGDFEKARDLLRIKSGAKADKVANRTANEGRIAYAKNGKSAALIEVSCETDFVARDDNIIDFADSIAQAVAQNGSVPDDILTLTLSNGQTVEQARQNMVMKLGENISIARAKILSTTNGEIYSYIHTGSKVAAMCATDGIDDKLAHGICMHIAAMRPRYVSEKNVPQDILDAEKAIYAAQAQETGKPADIASKIADGKIKKFLSDITLHGQTFVIDTEKTVAKILEEASGKVEHFELLVVGEANNA